MLIIVVCGALLANPMPAHKHCSPCAHVYSYNYMQSGIYVNVHMYRYYFNMQCATYGRAPPCIKVM